MRKWRQSTGQSLSIKRWPLEYHYYYVYCIKQCKYQVSGLLYQYSRDIIIPITYMVQRVNFLLVGYYSASLQIYSFWKFKVNKRKQVRYRPCDRKCDISNICNPNMGRVGQQNSGLLSISIFQMSHSSYYQIFLGFSQAPFFPKTILLNSFNME